MQIANLMNSPPLTVTATTPIWRAAETMDRTGYGFLPVTSSGKVVGVVTDRDLAIRVAARGIAAKTAPVSAVMTADPVCVGAEAGVEEAILLMRKRDVRRLLVVDAERNPLGVVALSNLAGAAADTSVVTNLRQHARTARRSGRAPVPGLFLG